MSLLTVYTPSKRQDFWSKWWSLKAPQRLKMLLWLVMQDVVLTNTVRVKRGFASDASCPICQVEIEDIDHVLRGCLIASDVWNHYHQNTQGIQGLELDIKTWITRNLDHTNPDPSWPTKFTTIVWWLWRWRNMGCFSTSADIPSDKIHFLHRVYKESIKVLNTDASRLNRINTRPTEVWVGWDPPPMDWVALKTDGASRHNPGNAGCGGFAEKLGVCSLFNAELRAIFRGLTLAKGWGIKHLVLNVDSRVIVNSLHGKHGCPARFFGITQKCKALIVDSGWEVQVTHCYREANKVADTLANVGVTLNCNFIVYTHPPRELDSLLYADKIGTKFPRMIASQ
ncbi:hypothetical protein Cgig2_028095 [Carnegiea gigantea]|uniref:RNase H type-1 domain-containing protein n=1 Tax=Carnegiea gigantea TaxID=171969 RepID=A0A9Q1KIM1_9CARY|nr:hypothetical protein Cgig2_028095 [Carnegiea gigantea]